MPARSALGDLDLHLLAEGRHERLWDVLGAHHRVQPSSGGSVQGVSFAVWAPRARQVQVRGDFHSRGSGATPLRRLGASGIWETFVPGVPDGATYRFDILGADGRWREKVDPLAFAVQPPPENAAVVHTSDHAWNDADWLARRTARERPMSVYEVHAGSWRRGLGYRELAHELADHVVEAGFTHVELLPVTSHPFGGSWGYQVTSYYAPAPMFGSPDDLRYLVDHMHSRGIGVVLDWVPAHFPRDHWALASFDGAPLYEHPDPRRADHPEWGTLQFDLGRPEVRNFLLASALYWIEQFHADGLRVDAVTSMLYLDYARQDGEWLPNEHGGRENLDAVRFLQELTDTVHRLHPGVLVIAEEATAWPGVTASTCDGGLGFDLKWNLGWMHDTLGYLGQQPGQRAAHRADVVRPLSYAWSERFLLPLSHDEVVHGKGSLWTRMPGDDALRAAGTRCLLAHTWAHPGDQLLFMGGEFGQVREWSEQRSLDWELLADPLHAGILRLTADLNAVYRSTPALHDHGPAGFAWIDGQGAVSDVVSFLRVGHTGPPLACVVNFAPEARWHRLGLPLSGRWREVINTDAAVYCGTGVGNAGSVSAAPEPWQEHPASACVRLPPTGALWLSHAGPA
ncbi:1,4-alpha-glucan branching protein GlgB [Saccharopolyspora erythraea]|uniref:1,4-alpha-glucan branching protein GlgB n=1 Tax=Saccharopolyspora erythraea TaxID=1836 RepID=UPI001BA98A41|nr:1,4-alpha-glucan branching protein GlgB [Saccharopolyspora erythraea]QUH02153.1 1,4-alpha-glucan branching protein GlgB [Saccharopolyspora erythraea]